ncbi:MAG: hypothetical protein U0U46_18005 [Saprospiraceae bacterium]
MNKALRIFCLCVLAGLSAHTAAAQQTRPGDRPRRDTVFVYDTLYVTDTVWLSPPGGKHRRTLAPLPHRQTEQIAAGRAAGQPKILWITADGTATLFQGSIMDHKNMIPVTNADSMKKIGFFGVVLLAFQHMVLAQNHVTLNAGTGMYRMVATPRMSARPGAAFSLGVGYRRDLIAGKLSAGGELNFHYLMRSDFDTLLRNGPYAGFSNPLSDDEDFSLKPLLFNLPLYLRWQTRWLSPCAGLDLYYKISPKKGYVVSGDGQILENARYRTPCTGLGLLLGLDAPISPRLSVALNYCQGLTREQSVDFNGTPFATRMQRLELQARYRLR